MDWTVEQIAKGLRNTAVKNQSKAAVELLIEHGHWLQALTREEHEPSPNNVRRFAQCGLDGEYNLRATLDWTAMAEHLRAAGHTYPKTDVSVFLLAASLREGVPSIRARSPKTSVRDTHS
ncbi:hypothetical protein ACIQPR_10015 [Streptomyces sp. NPDC091280]|uniref:hypothetical protein n=1 Tax=Streptomyces sp. NPDC091280 TaxID=3365984 RepID=UPI00380A7F0E